MLRGLAALGTGGRTGRQTAARLGALLRGFLLSSATWGLLSNPRPAVALPPSEPALSTTATVPASNEAMLLFSRIEQAIQQADWRLVLALRERLIGMGDDLVVVPPGRTYYPVWRQATKIFERLPMEGRELYRQMYEAEAAARLREVAPTGDIAALRSLFRTYAGLSTWPAIGAELTTQLMDQGQFAEAVETIQVLGAAQAELPPQRRAQLAVALGCLGHWQAARRHLDRLAADAAVQPSPWPERLAAIRDWIAQGVNAAGAGAPSASKLEPALGPGPLWCEGLAPNVSDAVCEDDLGIAEAITLTRRLPLQTALVAGETLITRMRGTIWAFDALALRPRWRVQEATAKGPSEQSDSSTVPVAMMLEAIGGQSLSPDASLLLSNPLRHGLATGAGLVFTIEAGGSSSGEPHELGVPRFGSMDFTPPANELVARDLATGREVWRRGYDPADALYAVSFQDVPIMVRERLCVPVVRAAELHVYLLDPASGETIAETQIVGPPTFFTGAGGRCQLLCDESDIYVATGNGVVAAVSSADLSWKWATTYASTLASLRNSGWWPPHEALREFSVDRPLLAGELLVLAPADAASIFALDRSTGRQRWRIERRTDSSLVGAVTAGVILAGNGLRCIDATDGGALRWRSVPLEITGRPAVCGERIFVPTRDGIVEVDGRTGKLLAEPGAGMAGAGSSRAGEALAQADQGACLRLFSHCLPTANLIATADALFAVAPNCLVKFPDLGASRRTCAARLAADSGDERARLAEVWLDLLGGDCAASLAKAEAFHPADAELARGRERILTDILVALSDSLGDQAERVALLRRAARTANSDEVSARLAILIGRALEGSGKWVEAAQHYQELLAPGHEVLIGEGGDQHHEQAAWLCAASRLRLAARQVAPEARQALWHDWVNSGAPEFLRRLRLATEDPGWQNKIDRALLLSSLPPEIRARHSVADDPELPRDQRRELHLARWDLDVRLGLLAEAQADQRYWQDQLANPAEYVNGTASRPATSRPSPAESDALGERVRTLEHALAELANLAAPPFSRELTGRYRWKLPNAEFVMDPAREQVGPAVLVRQRQDRIIGLHSVILGRQYKEIQDAQGSDSGECALEPVADAWWAGGDDLNEPALRDFWPAAIDGYMAAVSVQGGLLGLGLGCERSRDKLWSHALPEWDRGVERSGEILAAGSHGVYVAWRQDHVALLDWLDGAVCWERSLPGLRVEELLPVGQRLIIAGRDGDVISVDALRGDGLRTLSPVGGVPHAVSSAAGTVVVWTEDRVGGYDPASLACRWMRPCDGVEDWMRVCGSEWFMYREHDETDCHLIDAASGDAVFAGGLGSVGAKLTAGALDGERLLVAAFERQGGSGDTTPMVRLSAFDSESGQQLWQQEIPTLAHVNATQLLANADLIPVLVARSEYEYAATRNYNALALELVDKQSGQASEPVSILDDFRGTQGQCAACLLATPSRIIVQANGTIAAYGPASGKPR
jgi:outer membrane protein assembly factor BamB